MFQITEQAIVPPPMSVRAAGGFVAFEGRVRDHNDGRPVRALAYEAYAAMAEKQGNELLAEALRRFNILEARAIHRVGPLEIGDTAVWVGVAAAHRGDAFAACAWLMDEIKVRLPIWKKEEYAGGDAEWIGAGPS